MSSDHSDDDLMNPDVKIYVKDAQIQTNNYNYDHKLNMESIRESVDQLLKDEKIDKTCSIKIMKLVQNMERFNTQQMREKEIEIEKWKMECREHIVQERMSIKFNEILTTFTQRMNLLEEKLATYNVKGGRR